MNGLVEFEEAGKYFGLNKNDVVFTPTKFTKKICSMFPISGDVLEPCRGEGAFMKYLPKNSEWCEITEGKDFFDYNKKVDWIVTNPPYSVFDHFLDHSFELADNIVLLIPVAKVLKSMGTIRKVFDFGFVSCHFFPSSDAGFPFGFPCGVFYFKKNYNGKTTFKELT